MCCISLWNGTIFLFQVCTYSDPDPYCLPMVHCLDSWLQLGHWVSMIVILKDCVFMFLSFFLFTYCVLLSGLSLKSILSGSWQQLWWVANSISDKCYLSIIAIEIFFALLLTHYGKQPMNSNKLQKNLQISMFCSCLVKYVLLQKINVPVRRTSNNKQIFFKKSLVLHDLRL